MSFQERRIFISKTDEQVRLPAGEAEVTEELPEFQQA